MAVAPFSTSHSHRQQSLALVLVHIIFSTKNRMPFLQSAELRSGACLFDRNLAGLGVRPASGRRCGRSCAYSLWTLQKDLPRRIDQESQTNTEFVLRSDMCGIDPGELTPFQGGPVYWTVPGVETPGCIPVAHSGHRNKPKERNNIPAISGTGH